MLPHPSPTGLSPSPAGLPRSIPLDLAVTYAVRNPAAHAPRFGLSPFRSPLLWRSNGEQVHLFFLFLRLLRCFSSPGSPPCVMDSRMDTGGLLRWVSPFRHLRITAHLQLPAAFRSLSRLSSALSAKASSLCSFLLNLSDIGLFPFSRLAWRYSVLLLHFYMLCTCFPFCIFSTSRFLYIWSSDTLYISRCTPRMSCISRLQT